MANIELAPAVLRALGEGVQRLRDGDEKDCEHAEAVEDSMKAQGFVLCGYKFISLDRILVISHFNPHGMYYNDLTDVERASALRAAQLEDWETEVNEHNVLLAKVIQDIRDAKGLSRKPPLE